MKLLFSSDLHGDSGLYALLQKAAAQTRPDLIVTGGDMLPDDSALHPSRMGIDQPKYVRGEFANAVADIREAAGGAPLLFIFGNHDWGSSIPPMQELAASGLLTMLEPNGPKQIGKLSFLGYPYTPPTPWFVKDFERLDEPDDRPPLLGGGRWDPRFSRVSTQSASVVYAKIPTISEDLEAIKPPPAPWVFVAHSPPHASELDRSYARQPYGSRAIRKFIERHQPLLSLHGHIHESPRVTGSWTDKIGKTLAVNVGQSSGSLSYAEIEIDVSEGRISRFSRGQLA